MTGRGGWELVSVLELVRVHGEDCTREGLLGSYCVVVMEIKLT